VNWRTSVSAIPRGNAGNLRTLKAMSALARESSVDPVVVQAAQDAVRGTPERSPDSDFAAILSDVRRRMRYTHDPLDAEVVKSPRYVVDRTNLGGAPEPMDCDDASTLAGAMLGAIGYPTKFVTVAVDRERPDEWSHVYLTVRHPSGRWVPLDPIVRHFDAGDEVPAGQLTAPRAYHEGVDPMRGLGCDPRTTGVGSHPGGLGYCGRGLAGEFGLGTYTDETGTYAGTAPTTEEAMRIGGTQAWGNPSAGSSSGTPWYEQIANLAAGVYTAKQKADAARAIAASNAQIASANARLAVNRSGFLPGGSGGGFFRNPDGSWNTFNVVATAGIVVGLGVMLVKASRRR